MQCRLKVYLLFVTFDTETAEFRWHILTHPLKINSAFSVIAGLGHYKPRPTKFCRILESLKLREHTIHRKNLGKIRPQKNSPPA